MKTSQKTWIKPSQISPPSPKSQKYLYANYMAYTLPQDSHVPPPPPHLISRKTALRGSYGMALREGVTAE